MPNAEKEKPVEVIARALVRRCRSAALATSLGGARKGWPYASLVSVACATDGSPLLLLSTLADHTRNLIEDRRAALLFEEASHLPNPQTGPRVTLTGRLLPTTDESLAQRYLARHPGARLYAGFDDFSFYQMKVERAHYVGGFGRANWLAAKKYLYDAKPSDALSRAEQKLIVRLNKDYGQTVSQLTRNIPKEPGKRVKKARNWTIGGIDPEGLDVLCDDMSGRLEFDQPLKSGRGIWREIDELAKKNGYLE